MPRGGARPGSGPKPAKMSMKGSKDPLRFLLSTMVNPEIGAALRVRAAVAALAYTHKPQARGGIRDAQERRAQDAHAGKFAPAPTPPKLIVNNDKPKPAA